MLRLFDDETGTPRCFEEEAAEDERVGVIKMAFQVIQQIAEFDVSEDLLR
jgi:hypothetical protein